MHSRLSELCTLCAGFPQLAALKCRTTRPHKAFPHDFAKGEMDMSLMPDPTFYPSPRMAMQAPPERLGYVALLNVGTNGSRDALGMIDLEPSSSEYGRLVGQVDFPGGDNELHHFGWNACSACLCPQAPHAHMERRYLIVPGISSSRMHIMDTKGNPQPPKNRKEIWPEEVVKKKEEHPTHTNPCRTHGD